MNIKSHAGNRRHGFCAALRSLFLQGGIIDDHAVFGKGMLAGGAAEPLIIRVFFGAPLGHFLHAAQHIIKQGNGFRAARVAVQDEIGSFGHGPDGFQPRGVGAQGGAALQLHPKVVVDAVARDEQPILPDEDADAARRVARQFDDLCREAAQIEGIAAAYGLHLRHPDAMLPLRGLVLRALQQVIDHELIRRMEVGLLKGGIAQHMILVAVGVDDHEGERGQLFSLLAYVQKAVHGVRHQRFFLPGDQVTGVIVLITHEPHMIVDRFDCALIHRTPPLTDDVFFVESIIL